MFRVFQYKDLGELRVYIFGDTFCFVAADLVNLLGHEDIWDNLIRIKSPIVAAELLELALGDDKWESWKYES